MQIGDIAPPAEFGIVSTYPNPFNSRIIVEFSLDVPAEAILKVYDISGREITALTQGRYDAGSHSLEWNADDIPSGVYLLRLTAGCRSQVVKVVLLR